MKRVFIAIVSCAVMVFGVTSVEAAGPFALQQNLWLQNYTPPPSTIGECARQDNGSYGAIGSGVFFANTNSYASFGGFCNATNNRPASWIQARAKSFAYGVLYQDSGYVASTSVTYTVQATVPYVSAPTTYQASGFYYLSGAGVFSNSPLYAR